MSTDDKPTPRPVQRYSMADLSPANTGGAVPPGDPWYRAAWIAPIAAIVVVALVGFLGLRLLSDDDGDTAENVRVFGADAEETDDAPVLSGVESDGAPGDPSEESATDTAAPVLDGGDEGSGGGDAGDGAGSGGGAGSGDGGSAAGGAGSAASSTTTTTTPAAGGATTTTAGGGGGATTTAGGGGGATTTTAATGATTTTTAAGGGSNSTTTTVAAGATVVVAESRYSAPVVSFFDEAGTGADLSVHLYDAGGFVAVVLGGWSTVDMPLCVESSWEDSPQISDDDFSFAESAINTCGPVEDFTDNFFDCGNWAYAITTIPSNATGEFYIAVYDGEFEYYAFPDEDFFLGSNGALTPFSVGARSYTLPLGILPSGTAGTC